MILTVTLNAAVDRTLTVPNFALGFRHKATHTLSLPGGKGVNVARAVKILGQPVIATGFAGGRVGDRMVTQLQREGILCDFVRIEGESRTSTAVLDPTTGDDGLAQDLHRAGDVDALPPGEAQGVRGLVAKSQREVGYGEGAVDGGIKGYGQDHSDGATQPEHESIPEVARLYSEGSRAHGLCRQQVHLAVQFSPHLDLAFADDGALLHRELQFFGNGHHL